MTDREAVAREALQTVRKFLESEYSDHSAKPNGEWLAKDARLVHGAICEALVALAAPPEAQPHHYNPSVTHMGDCSICGNVEDHPSHKMTAPPDTARGEPFERNATNDQIAAVMLQTGKPAQIKQALEYAGVIPPAAQGEVEALRAQVETLTRPYVDDGSVVLDAILKLGHAHYAALSRFLRAEAAQAKGGEVTGRAPAVKALEWVEYKALAGGFKTLANDCFGNEFRCFYKRLNDVPQADIDAAQVAYDRIILAAITRSEPTDRARPVIKGVVEKEPTFNGGFTHLIVDGVRYTDIQVATALEAVETRRAGL